MHLRPLCCCVCTLLNNHMKGTFFFIESNLSFLPFATYTYMNKYTENHFPLEFLNQTSKLKIITTETSLIFSFLATSSPPLAVITPPASCCLLKHLLVHIVSCRLVLAGHRNRRNSFSAVVCTFRQHQTHFDVCEKSHLWLRHRQARPFTQLFGL